MALAQKAYNYKCIIRYFVDKLLRDKICSWSCLYVLLRMDIFIKISSDLMIVHCIAIGNPRVSECFDLMQQTHQTDILMKLSGLTGSFLLYIWSVRFLFRYVNDNFSKSCIYLPQEVEMPLDREITRPMLGTDQEPTSITWKSSLRSPVSSPRGPSQTQRSRSRTRSSTAALQSSMRSRTPSPLNKSLNNSTSNLRKSQTGYEIYSISLCFLLFALLSLIDVLCDEN